MNLIYLLLTAHTFILLIILVVLFALTGFFGTYLFRKYIQMSPQRSHNELIGYMFATLAGFYGLLLGFVVFLAWDSLNRAQTDASLEGSAARDLYRDIKYYPRPAEVAELKSAYLDYVDIVVKDEFPAMEALKPIDKHNRDAFNKVFRTMGQLDMNNPYFSQMFAQLNQLATYRSIRQLDASSAIPLEVWVPLLLGGAIILVFAVMLDVESLRLHLMVNAMLGAFIGLVVYIIIIVDHPFTGRMKIEPVEYRTILSMEKEDI